MITQVVIISFAATIAFGQWFMRPRRSDSFLTAGTPTRAQIRRGRRGAGPGGGW